MDEMEKKVLKLSWQVMSHQRLLDSLMHYYAATDAEKKQRCKDSVWMELFTIYDEKKATELVGLLCK